MNEGNLMEEIGAARCGAKTRAGTPCRRMPVRARKRCHLHGGQSPRWWWSKRFKHGRYSKYSANQIVRRRKQCVAIKANGERCRQWTQEGSRCFAHRIWPMSDAELDHLLAKQPRELRRLLKREGML